MFFKKAGYKISLQSTEQWINVIDHGGGIAEKKWHDKEIRCNRLFKDEKKKKKGGNPLQNNASLQPKKQSMPCLKKMVAKGF